MTLTPQQTFWSDQALAAAREEVKDGRTFAIVNDFANGEQCSWCDCPLEAHYADYQCGGCPNSAASVLRTFNGSQVRRDIPVCAGHHADAVATIALVITGRP